MSVSVPQKIHLQHQTGKDVEKNWIENLFHTLSIAEAIVYTVHCTQYTYSIHIPHNINGLGLKLKSLTSFAILSVQLIRSMWWYCMNLCLHYYAHVKSLHFKHKKLFLSLIMAVGCCSFALCCCILISHPIKAPFR